MKKLWGKRKYKQIKIKHHLLTNLPKRASDEVIQALLLKVRNGDVNACQLMVKEHMLLAKLKIQDFLSDYPHLQNELDDLVSVAMTAVVDAVNRVKTGSMKDHNNITGYIRVAIWRHLGDWITKRLQDSVIKQLPKTSYNEDHDFVSLDENDGVLTTDDHGYMEVMDTLESLDLLEEEWFIIESRLVGDTFKEIADNYSQIFSYNSELTVDASLSEFCVRYILQDILQRYLEKVNENV